MPNSDDKMKTIEQIAFDLFLNNGYDATSVRMICNKAGIEPPTLYYYFGSKKGLFFAIVENLLKCYRLIPRELILGNHQQAKDKLYNLYEHSINFTIQHYQETKFYFRYIIFTPSELQEDIQSYIQDNFDFRRRLYQECIEECIQQGEIQSDVQTGVTKLINFIDNATSNIIFSQWKPTSEEMKENIDIFYKYQLNGK